MSSTPESAPTPTDLVDRLNLMEAMIAEGRATTARYGWIFVMWGLLYCFAMTWCGFFPHKNWAWPIAIVAGVVASGIVRHRQRQAGINLRTPRAHSIESVWKAMGTAVTIFSIACAFSHAITQPLYFGAMMFMVGLAHATSAMILRWRAQGVAALIWWAGGIAALFFTADDQLFLIFMLATLFGMVFFGLYAMLLERRRTGPPAAVAHA